MTRAKRYDGKLLKGSYQIRKDGTCQVKYPIGWSTIKNKYDEYREDVPSEAAAQSLLEEIEDYIYHGGEPRKIPQWRNGTKADEESCSLTVSQYIEDFIATREKRKKFQPRTIESYHDCFNRIEPYIGKLPLKALNPLDIEVAYAHMKSSGKDNVSGHVYKETTLLKTHTFLTMALNKAVDYEYIPRNPMNKVDRPKNDTPEKRALSAEQAQALFAQVKAEPLSAESVGIILCLGCGLRISETLSLQWTDIKDGYICITKSLRKDRQDYKSTKNDENRTFPCPPPVIEILDKWKGIQQSQYKEFGLKWSNKAPIINNSVGTHILQSAYNKWFALSREHYSLPKNFTPHGLRHTFVTLMSRDCHVDSRTARSISGHKTEAAFSIYKHTDEEWRQQATTQYGRLLSPEGNTATCQNCKFWTMSPIDPTKGCCWADEKKSGTKVTNTIDKCSIGKFSLKQVHNDNNRNSLFVT